MRIVGGRHRGRPIAPPPDGVRPTSDRAREAVFNILEHGIAGAAIAGVTVLDVFAGSGAMGLEALSRGAQRVTFIDTSGEALRGIRRNAAKLGEAANATLLKLDIERLPPPPRVAGTPAALAFLDPPYGSGLAAPALVALAARGWIAADTIVVAEVAAREPFTPPPGFEALDERSYGAARMIFLRKTKSASS